LKRAELEIMPSLSWINLSGQLVRKLKLPKGTLFRIYPVDGRVENRDEEDHSYTFNWESDKQYWFDIIYDISRDLENEAKVIKMIDGYGRVDRLVVRKNASESQILSQ
jgi:hypothetical protein